MFTLNNPSLSLAQQLDAEDPLVSFKNEFIAPGRDGAGDIYFLGNSLGLQPNRTREYLHRILDDWSSLGVESFFHASEPWMYYHQKLAGPLAQIVGAKESEVVVMNNLTVNLHLMMASFYHPVGKKNRILCEAKAFPSDQYAFETHVKHHGLTPEAAVLEVSPRQGEHLLRTEDILQTIRDHKDEIALILLGGLHYYTGQVLDMEAITREAHSHGIIVGFDLAHAAGNIRLSLHDWGVDFACWCNYKYLNAGPGAIGAAFIHERHHKASTPRLAGWWGYDAATRFKMEKGFIPMAGAEGWQLSTPAILLYATLHASLDVFMEAGWEKLNKKRRLLNDFLWSVVTNAFANTQPGTLEILTPTDPTWRGCQISLLVHKNGKELFEHLLSIGIRTDWREPNVIRFAPVPLYNSFEEVYRLGEAIRRI
ncbi:MAG: kynureninase [Chitinophagaceae bacterium]|nr:kynureninase [Chitinophagaceae bacterium]